MIVCPCRYWQLSSTFYQWRKVHTCFFLSSGPFPWTFHYLHWIYRFMTVFLETENSINSHNLIPLIRQVLDFAAPVKVSLKLHLSCVHLMKGNQKIANFYKKKVNPFSKVFNRKVLFCHIPVSFFPFSLLSLVWQTLVN